MPTKRRVLSDVAQLYDPTGFLAPVIISGKVFIQTLWSTGISWDTPLPKDLCHIWSKFRNDLGILDKVRVPRWLGMDATNRTSLYGFCDASQKAYAAVVYARTIDNDDKANKSLLTARTKVAPLKGATIPRLELCGALLLAKTICNVRKALSLEDTSVHLLTDSSIVLSWLRKQPVMLKPYIANRVRQIQQLTSLDLWHYVRSAQNPADCASRGVTPSELLGHHLWWSGPDWLRQKTTPFDQAPELQADERITMQSEERSRVLTFASSIRLQLITRRIDGQHIPLAQRFSSIKRLVRTTAIVLLWLPRYRHFRHHLVTAPEMDNALELLIRIDQSSAFPQDLRCLGEATNLSSSSPPYSHLTPT
ncbi:uncharacterized protein LOC120780713 [Bactrocera tryoni]|uniref:uncharacterized protein LOC120780713 n=1 Tax=Bactrocera tryoni TaxID=59916 RepID=UPI001A96A655|nr:uncharacterized protein LOC120780713 [Bactrocera tryoni]